MMFVDAIERNQKYPETFHIPSKKLIDRLQPGDHVKIAENNERFWAQIESIDGDNMIVIVDNDLVNKHDFKLGDKITIEKRHILGTL